VNVDSHVTAHHFNVDSLSDTQCWRFTRQSLQNLRWSPLRANIRAVELREHTAWHNVHVTKHLCTNIFNKHSYTVMKI